MNGTNKDVCGAKLHPTAVLAYPVDCDCLCHLLNTHYCCLCLNGSLNMLSASQPTPTTPRPLLPTHPFIRAIPDIMVAVKKVAQNPAVLAS